MIHFDGVKGTDSIFTMKRTETGYECFLNGQKIPNVLSEKLVIGEGVPKVVLEIAVKAYSGTSRITGINRLDPPLVPTLLSNTCPGNASARTDDWEQPASVPYEYTAIIDQNEVLVRLALLLSCVALGIQIFLLF